MKKIMMIAAMMIATISASAQNEVGQLTLQPKAGINLSNITGENDTKIWYFREFRPCIRCSVFYGRI